MEINKKAIIISLTAILLLGSIFLIFLMIKPLPFVSAIPQCTGESEPCEGYGTQSNCQRCGCDWTDEIARKINIGDAWKDVTGMKINTLEAGCSGTPSSCVAHDELDCALCGCDWDGILEECEGIPDSCSSHASQGDCEVCGCGWNVESWKTVTNVYINIGDAWKTVADTGSCGGTPSACSAHGEEECEYCGCFWSP
ncbi:MAG: hypothetical protein E3J56_00995 [Candidatus Aminicenantes bacterium]|nr:MAG: hypothetical protein E3J56_00995 [Candidatus Aminicenantes bacterium]